MNAQVNYIVGHAVRRRRGSHETRPGGNRGAVDRLGSGGRQPVWVIKENFPVWSGTVVTAGDLVFYGTMDGWFKAVNARTGEIAWKYKVDSGIIGQPISYKGPDGHQYIAVLSGVGGWSGAVVSGPVDPRDG